jgi:DNA-binding response OmpR family regulator
MVIHVLLFESDPDVAHMLRFLLRHLGCTVQTVTELAAITAPAAAAPPLALVDPGDTPQALTVCRQVQEATTVPVICLAASTADPAIPAVYWLPVPVSPRALRALVQRLLALPHG